MKKAKRIGYFILLLALRTPKETWDLWKDLWEESEGVL